jgi:hypothetical protein
MSIIITEVRNARSMNDSNTSINVEINHPQYGWIPYLLTDYDTDTTVDNDAVMALIGTDFAAYAGPEHVLLTQEQTDEINALGIRTERNDILITFVDPVVSNQLRWGALTDAQQTKVTDYRTNLLNITDQSTFPTSVAWPTRPSVLNL